MMSFYFENMLMEPHHYLPELKMYGFISLLYLLSVSDLYLRYAYNFPVMCRGGKNITAIVPLGQ